MVTHKPASPFPSRPPTCRVTRSVRDKEVTVKGPAAALLVPLVLLPTWPGARAATIHVPHDQPTIQAGIDAASYGDTVLVECGTYYEHDIQMESGVRLRSETGLADCVTIDGQGVEERGIYCFDVDEQGGIEGFTITNALGGGMFCHISSPLVRNCTFVGNGHMDLYYGGGMLCRGVLFSDRPSSMPTLENCVFLDNAADTGGGVCCDEDSGPTLVNCLFSENRAYRGGDVYCEYYSWPTFDGCTFAGATRGGGVACSSSLITLTGCTFYREGLSVLGQDTSVTLSNTIFAFGTGVAVHCDWGTASANLLCCDIYGYSGGDWVDCIAGQSGIDGNISEDPLFCDEESGDFTLDAASPCAPASNPPCGLVGAWDVGCETPAERTSWGTIKAAFR